MSGSGGAGFLSHDGGGVQRHGFSTFPGDGGGEYPKAAAVIIGDEILKGTISDVNLPFLTRMMYNRGLDMVRAEFVPDVEEEIVEALLRIKSKVGENGVIITTGGIGPTHDDKTYSSIAKAFGVGLELHQPTVERMRTHYESQGKMLNEARLKMATLPEGSEVLVTDGLWVPLAVLNGVYILPGIPRLFQKMITAHESRFKGPSVFSHAIYTNSGEGDLADSLTAIAEKHPSCDIGSYPNTGKTETEAGGESYATKLVLNSRDRDLVRQVSKEIFESIPECFERDQ
ncbi:FAD synthase [Chloropicon primus]|uniref:FAD synthase n=1 Tax=Chloropicon primus TaxID=1764295 RepID=A0A5B8MJV8_9CHLO|nr:FAD synthase [Chloropicon primus]UPQ99186.1 FAD synthase [Chloropicon primus]|eukprot:QDZ19975.1 FAD synthase [Chloropicon primus]